MSRKPPADGHQCALLIVSPEALRAALQIDERAAITGVYQPHDLNGNLLIRVHGVGPFVQEGHLIPTFNATIHRLEHGAVKIEWNLPE